MANKLAFFYLCTSLYFIIKLSIRLLTILFLQNKWVCRSAHPHREDTPYHYHSYKLTYFNRWGQPRCVTFYLMTTFLPFPI